MLGFWIPNGKIIFIEPTPSEHNRRNLSPLQTRSSWETMRALKASSMRLLWTYMGICPESRFFGSQAFAIKIP